MKKFIIILLVLFSSISKAQNIFVVQFRNEAQVKVCIVNHISDADLIVYITPHVVTGEQNDGKWHMVNYRSQARKLIIFTNHLSDCDLKIFYTTTMSQAGWKNNSKKHLLE
jgi:hypothetical protein